MLAAHNQTTEIMSKTSAVSFSTQAVRLKLIVISVSYKIGGKLHYTVLIFSALLWLNPSTKL